jgi:hypothetical protein
MQVAGLLPLEPQPGTSISITHPNCSQMYDPPFITFPGALGLTIEEAVACIQAAAPDATVRAMELNTTATADSVCGRVRVRYDPATNLVTEVPRRG